jgi:transcriptional regulator with XRE-family HTH domain
VHKDRLFLVVDLDDRHACNVITACLTYSGLTQAKFAHLMGVSLSALTHWLQRSKLIPRWAVRAAYFAAISAGVPVRFPQPGPMLMEAVLRQSAGRPSEIFPKAAKPTS